MSKNSNIIKKLLGLSTTMPMGSGGSKLTGAHLHSHGHAHGSCCGCGHSHDDEDEDFGHDHKSEEKKS